MFGSLSPTAVKRYDQTTSSLQTATQAEPGQAYYVHMTAASTWTPPLPKDVTTNFVYDGDGGRVKQITVAGTTTFLGQNFEKAPDGKTTKYIFAGSQRIVAKDSTGDLRFYHGDHLGSSNTITNATGQLVELTEHSPYGAISRHEGTANVPQKFTGQRQDAANGLVLFPARAYDPELGRFLQADPFVQDPGDPQTLNRYSYVRNNPINLVDPTGYGWLRKLLAIVVAIVATILMPEGAGIWWNMAAGIVGAVVGDQAGAAIEGRSDGSSSAFLPIAVSSFSDAAVAAPGTQSASSSIAITGSPLESVSQADDLDQITAALTDSLGISDQAAPHVASGFVPEAGSGLFLDLLLFGGGLAGFGLTAPVPDPTDPVTLGAIAKGGAGLVRRGLIKVRHFTGNRGRGLITKRGYLKKNTHVTKPRSAPRGHTQNEIEDVLEIKQGRGKNYIDLTVRKSDLKVPPNGPRTSGRRWQRQLRRDIPIDPTDFKTYGP